MIIKTIKAIHKRWVFKAAFADVYYASDMMYSPRHNRALYLYNMTQRILWTMKILYPIFFLMIFFDATCTILALSTINDVIHLFSISCLLGWSLFIYLTMMHWLWYKKACHKMKTLEEKKLIRFIMKKMLKLTPYYLATHAFFLLLFNCWVLASVVLLDEDSLLVVLMLPTSFVFIFFIFYVASYWWIRMATYPLRNKLFRT